MNQLQQAFRRRLEGPTMTAFLLRLDIDPPRFWILKDLFRTLSKRQDGLQQLGGMGLQTMALLWFVVMGLVSLAMLVFGVGVEGYLLLMLGMTALLLLVLLVPECAESLVNPAEGIILAHQPVNGATYTGAKLSHLIDIVVYVVLGINTIPAILGTFLVETPWYYAGMHITAALAVGFTVALLSASAFGWLLRTVPVTRMKGVAATMQAIPLLLYFVFRPVGMTARVLDAMSEVLAAEVRLLGVSVPGGRLTVVFALGASLLLPAVVFGLRSLTADYLIRVSTIVQGGSAARVSRTRTSTLGRWTARWFGGQPGRAGFDYLLRMIARDWQFRRSMIATLPLLGPSIIATAAVGFSTSPFDRGFAPAHLVPQMQGIVMLITCSFLVFGADYKGTGVFRQVPDDALTPFGAGVFGGLFLLLAVMPNLILLPVGTWFWGATDALLFTGFSTAVASIYLGLALRLVRGIPFGRLYDPKRMMFTLPIALLGLIGAGLMVGLQYLLFRSMLAVVVATPIALMIALGTGRRSIRALGATMRFDMKTNDGWIVGVYQEVD